MIDRVHTLPLTQQASLLRLSRSSVYYLPRPAAPARLAIMHRIDALHLEYPFAVSRMLRDCYGQKVSRSAGWRWPR
jgi:putative transposase